MELLNIIKLNYVQDFTPEDYSRRQKRRDRNKIAAEKCRVKKKKETINLFAESEEVERQNACYKYDIVRLEAEQSHLMSILAQHKPVCKKVTKSESVAIEHPTWHFDESNTFRVPSIPPSAHHKNIAIEEQLKTEACEVFMSDDARDYSTKQSDWNIDTKENVAKTSIFKTSPIEGYEVAKYSNLSYHGYSIGNGYYDRVIAT